MLLIPIKTKQLNYQNMLLIPMDTNKNKTHNALDTNTNGDEMNIKLKTHAYQLQ